MRITRNQYGLCEDFVNALERAVETGDRDVARAAASKLESSSIPRDHTVYTSAMALWQSYKAEMASKWGSSSSGSTKATSSGRSQTRSSGRTQSSSSGSGGGWRIPNPFGRRKEDKPKVLSWAERQDQVKLAMGRRVDMLCKDLKAAEAHWNRVCRDKEPEQGATNMFVRAVARMREQAQACKSWTDPYEAGDIRSVWIFFNSPTPLSRVDRNYSEVRELRELWTTFLTDYGVLKEAYLNAQWEDIKGRW